jgi:hypothetical protein
VIPNDALRAWPARDHLGNRTRGVAAVGAEHEAAFPLEQPHVGSGRPLGATAVVLDDEPRSRPARPQLQPGTDLRALRGVPAARRHNSPYKRGKTSLSSPLLTNAR